MLPFSNMTDVPHGSSKVVRGLIMNELRKEARESCEKSEKLDCSIVSVARKNQ